MTGGYVQRGELEKTCSTCSSRKVRDEIHLLTDCADTVRERQKLDDLIGRIKERAPIEKRVEIAQWVAASAGRGVGESEKKVREMIALISSFQPLAGLRAVEECIGNLA
uniref:Uncharacterized protein n=1 Tax=Chromera velia CCMP2878 TaxID=1169474 RepID=A0A0G4FKQ0_9ALVE|eukprot:Cvel_17452.t1-p1 / transcript=Cvel_17452.t1 / gene=Cvel_17452 / organism=Chromera_velia_CCMP2878 / gene_product=hypothetical protein / transcript_product=hypothetical protein / location=Cvel_scaffold1393:31337-31660(-) / protein_length=108 / sequence_SO=supercontig / SO=protein_coding / is_pseudo=false